MSDQGHSVAQLDLAKIYIHGAHVKRDINQAFILLKKSAKNGNLDAKFLIGELFEDRELYDKAVKMYKLAAHKGHTKSQIALGVIYSQGKFLKQDYVESLKWFKEAATNGNSEAQKIVASMYEGGLGVKSDHAEAYKWYYSAAKSQDVEAIERLGWMLATGTGVKEDKVKAYAWFIKAQRKGLDVTRWKKRLDEELDDNKKVQAKKLSEGAIAK